MWQDALLMHSQILVEHCLRANPFTDTLLREMAINFPTSRSFFVSVEQEKANVNQANRNYLLYRASDTSR